MRTVEEVRAKFDGCAPSPFDGEGYGEFWALAWVLGVDAPWELDAAEVRAIVAQSNT